MDNIAEPSLHYLEYGDFLSSIGHLSHKIDEQEWRPDFVIGIGRGGLVPAVYISHHFELPMLSIDHSSKIPGFADELLAKVASMSTQGQRILFVDDINDSGGTIDYILGRLEHYACQSDNLRFAVMINNIRSKATVDFWANQIDRGEDKRWFVFPWEAVGTRETIVGEALSVPERLSRPAARAES